MAGLLKAYLAGRATLRRAFVLIDARHGIKPVDEEIMTLLDTAAVTFQVVLTKADKVKAKDRDRVLAQVRKRLAPIPPPSPSLCSPRRKPATASHIARHHRRPRLIGALHLSQIRNPTLHTRTPLAYWKRTNPDASMKKQTMTRDYIATARTLSEALPYLQRFNEAIVVIKFGGNAMGDDEAMASFARDIVLLRQVGVNPVVVHGGGPMINEMLDRLGITSTS
jgi:G3E family GTPase